MSKVLPRIYLVRHGETAWSITGQHTGKTDIPLTAKGERDAEGLISHLKKLSFGLVLTSPLQRARRTAELAGFSECAEVDPDLSEWDYGAYEGLRTSEIRVERPDWRLFEDGCPGGETLADVSTRADRVIARIRGLGVNVVIFAHGHILRVVTARWIELSALEGRRLYLAPTSVSILGYDHDLEEPVIHLLNDVWD